MKLKFIIGILAFLLLMVSTASAYELDDGTSDTASEDNVTVTADYSSNTITFTATDLNGGSADIKKIGFNIDPDKIQSITITDNAGQTWSPDLNGGQMDGLGDYLIVASNPDASKKPSVVTVTFTFINSADTVSSLIQKNDNGFETCVHVAWTGGDAGVSGSAYVAGSIPEFPTIAAPVAAIIGLMFVMGRRKKE